MRFSLFHILRAVGLSIAIPLFVGCANEAPSVAGASFEPPANAAALDTTLAGSLFKEDQQVISNEDIAAVLGSKIQLPNRARLAAVRFGQMPYWWGWSEDFVRTNQKIDDDFLGRLRESKRLRQVSYLPSLLTPTQMTIPFLREAAARCQADLLLIYRTSSRSYDRQRFLGPDEVKAYCTVEAVILDTRTGTAPFSTVVTEDFAAKRTSTDSGFDETISKANQRAIGKAWLKLADQVKDFLDAPAESTAQVQ